jgi:glycosyltransferase involved in cell wall biosynthesis
LSDSPEREGCADRRRVLFVAQDLAPSAIVGARRPSKFCKYLPDFGWMARVLTVREEYYAQRDAESATDILGRCEIIRTNVQSLPWIVQAPLNAARSVLRRNKGAGPKEGKTEASPAEAQSMWWTIHVLRDPGMMWLRPALRAGRQALEGCDCIWSTYPWGANHLIAMQLARESGLPWIADFRDPWSFGTRQTGLARWKRWMNRRSERRTIETCRFVVSTTEAITKRFREAYPDADPSKFMTIRNGVDPADFANGSDEASRALETKVFRAAYFGTLYAGRDPTGLFEAIAELLKAGTIRADRFRLDLYGPIPVSLEERIAQCGVADVVHPMGLVGYRKALALMRTYSVLAVIGSEQTDDLCLATKLYEYLYARRPILALVPPGPVQRFVEKHGAGAVLGGRDTAGIASALQRWYDDFQADRLTETPGEFPTEYDRRFQTGQLADLLNRALRESASGQTRLR